MEQCDSLKVCGICDEMMIISGRANPKFAADICDVLRVKETAVAFTDFSDGEILPQIQDNVRGRDVFVVQSLCHPVNNNIIELLLIIDALKRASAARITAVIPYFAYARQDRKLKSRVPISSKMLADLLDAVGVDRILTMDLHAGQIQGFFNVPTDHLYASKALVEKIKAEKIENLVIVSPDAGGVPRAVEVAENLGAGLAVIEKMRKPGIGNVKLRFFIGDVRGKNALIVDDIIDTAGTVLQTVDKLKEEGADDIYIACSHPVLSGPGLQRMRNKDIKRVFVTDTIPHEYPVDLREKVDVITVAPMFAEAIKRIHNAESISELFNDIKK